MQCVSRNSRDFRLCTVTCKCQVEELSASAADKKQAKGQSDPLDQYCDDNPEADECRYEHFSFVF